jgi:uncharacterized protein (TIGR03437 family)
MTPTRRVLINSLLLVLAIAPTVVYSHYYGPDPGYTAAPGDDPNGCAAGGSCHVGTPNTGGGSVTISPAFGTSYVPGGPAEQITVAVSDPVLNKTGFELTARIDSNPTNDAGTFTASGDGYTQIVTCATSVSGAFYAGSCGNTLHWIEQTANAFYAGATTYTFSWTPPATNAGTVTLYAAGNAGNGNTSSPLGTHVYLTSVQLSPAAPPPPPTITVINPNDSSATSIQPGSWIWIKGTNLASTPTLWTGNFPTSLGGASVTINNKPGYLYYASPTQINLQAPDDTSTGAVSVVVTTAGGSATATVTLAPYSPAWSLLDATHVAGIILRNGTGAYGNGTYDIIGPTGNSLGYATVAAKAGDSVVLFGIGFGPTSPAVAAGQVFSGAAPLVSSSSLQLSIAGTTVTPSFAGLTSAGLYQFNLTIPPGLPAGDQPLTATAGGVTTQSGIVISLQ